MYELPTEILINGNPYPIRNGGDYRLILDVISHLTKAIKKNDFKDTQDIDLEHLYSALIIFFDGLDTIADINANFTDLNVVLTEIYNFINCGQNTENQANKGLKLIDWQDDEQLIISAINNVAKTEVRAMPYLHWWSFIAYYMAIGECSLAHIVSIRKKIATGKKLEKYEKEFKRENPEYFASKSDATTLKQMEDFIKDIWEG